MLGQVYTDEERKVKFSEDPTNGTEVVVSVWLSLFVDLINFGWLCVYATL